MKERTLAGQLSRGDSKALGKIIAAYSDYVRVVARNFSRGTLSAEDTDEIVSDVFYKLWKCRQNIDPEAGLRPYLSAAVRNAVKNRFKQSPPICGDIDGLELSADIDVFETAERGDMMKCLYEGMKLLNDSEREAFFRFYFYGEKCSEIARLTRAEENTVYTRLRRAREKLREYLNERGYYHV